MTPAYLQHPVGVLQYVHVWRCSHQDEHGNDRPWHEMDNEARQNATLMSTHPSDMVTKADIISLEASRHTARLSDEALVSVAEHTMEQNGHAGRTWHVPKMHADDPQRQEAHQPVHDFVRGVLTQHGYEHAHGINVIPSHWDLREPGSGQAMVNAIGSIGLKGEHTNDLTLLHECAHLLTRTPEGPGGHGPQFQEAAHRLYHDHISPEAADTFNGIVHALPREGARHTAGTTMPLAELRELPLDNFEGVRVKGLHLSDAGREWGAGNGQSNCWVEHGGPADEYLDHLRHSIRQHGIQNPIVIAHAEDGKARVLDGNHRAIIAHEEGIDPVPVRHVQDNQQHEGTSTRRRHRLAPRAARALQFRGDG